MCRSGPIDKGSFDFTVGSDVTTLVVVRPLALGLLPLEAFDGVAQRKRL